MGRQSKAKHEAATETVPINAIRCYLDQSLSPCGQNVLRSFVDHLDDYIIVFDLSGTILYTNPTVSRRLGYSAAELDSINIEKVFPGVMALIEENGFFKKTGGRTIVETRQLVSRNGKKIPVEIKLSNGRWKGSKACISVSRDVTARVEVENALRESERRLSTLMSNLPGMAYRCKNNRNWTMEFVSEGCFDLTGYKPKDFIDDRRVSWNDLMHPDDRQWVYDAVQEAVSGKEFFRLVFRLTTRSGQKKWVWEQGVGVYDQNGDVLALEGFITDVTEHEQAREQLHSENILLRTSMKDSYKFCGIVGRSRAMQRVFETIMQAAKSQANVIIYGESGTGKELTARAIHDLSERRSGRFVPVNCGAIPENLVESEFFGYKKGAFSGAFTDKPGFLDLADGGTLFLDEVGDINPNLQVKLLRAIEGGGYTPVGGQRVKSPDIRIVAATHTHLKELLDSEKIREDFFYRIHVVPIYIPPLRERKEDLPLLIVHFLKTFGNENAIGMIPQDIMNAMYNYDWPGNVRELQNVLQRYTTINQIDLSQMRPKPADLGIIDTTALTMDPKPGQTLQSALAHLEKHLILQTLEQHYWHRGKCAEALGLNYRTLLRKMKRHNIDCHKI